MRKCRWTGCDEKKDETRSYRNCNKCGRAVGPIVTPYCREHSRGTSKQTGCRFRPPYTWSCLRCYPEDFDNWIPDTNEFGPIENWHEILTEMREELKQEEFEAKICYVFYDTISDASARKGGFKTWYKKLEQEMGEKEAREFIELKSVN